MSSVNHKNVHSFDAYIKKDWVNFLEQGAYRGLKINKAAKRLANAQQCNYDSTTHKLDLIDKKGKTITLDMDRIHKKNERWSLSRLIHNIRMCFSGSEYAMKFNARIAKLADVILKDQFTSELETFVDGDADVQEIETFFNKNLRKINESGGNQTIQDDLRKLADQALDKADDAQSRALAFQVRCTAMSLSPLPSGTWDGVPADIKNLIFAEAGKTNTDLNLVSKQIALAPIENDDIEFKKCQTAGEQVKYIIDHQMSSVTIHDDFTDQDIDSLIEGCAEISKISIRNCQGALSDDVLVKLTKKFPNLQELTLDGEYFSQIIDAFRELNDLRSLKICEANISGQEFIEIAEMHPNLRRLNITRFDKISDEIVEVTRRFSRLGSLKLYCFISSYQLKEIVKNQPHVHTLSFNCDNISGRQIVKSLEGLSDLSGLNIGYCNELYDSQVVEIVKGAPNLEHLTIRSCEHVNENALRSALQNFPNLQLKVSRF